MAFQAVNVARQPGQISYQSCSTAVGGQPLWLAEPFGIALDTGKLLG